MRLLLILLLASCAGPTADDDDSAAAEDPTPEVFEPPDWCPDPAVGRHEVVDTDASPYFLQHPSEGEDPPTLVWLPGGAGTGGAQGHATRSWEAFFTADLPELARWRVVMPYVDSGSFVDDAARTHAVVDEVLACFGGDAVHLGGTSNGGNAAFAEFLADSSRFANLATLPGCIGDYDAGAHQAAFGDAKVLNGVGDGDEAGWKNCVEASHDFLVAQGIDSTHRVYLNVPHVPPAAWTGIADILEFLDD